MGSAKLIAAAGAELQYLVRTGLLRGDPDDVCNPLQRSADVPLWQGSIAAECPHLAHCIARLFNLPLLLEAQLGLSLRVPQTVMMAAYPPGAKYRRHYDSYGGRDIPRYITCLLYLAWEPQEGGQLRAYPARKDAHPRGLSSVGVKSAASDDAALEAGLHRDISPLPGRLCIFFSQEVEHEVLPSQGERLALTLWIWSTERDDQGR